MSNYLMVPSRTVISDLITQNEFVVYVPIATQDTYGVVKIGEGLRLENGIISFNDDEITILSISKNGNIIAPDVNKNVNITLTKDDVGLAYVDNTSDINKPVSLLQQQELDKKVNILQGISNVGKALVVGGDGRLGLREISITLDENVLTDITTSVAGDTFNLVKTSKNLQTLIDTQQYLHLSLANDVQSGLMSTADYRSIRDLQARVGQLEHKTTRLLYSDKLYPTAEEINTFVTGLGYSAPFDGVAVIIDGTNHIWHYYENDSIGWKDDGLDVVSQFTNEIAGIIKGSATDGKIYAETDGTGSVYGWDDLKTSVENNTLNITSITERTGELEADILDLQSQRIDTDEFLKKSGTYQYMTGEFILNNAQLTVLQSSKIRNANNDVYRYSDDNGNIFGNTNESAHIETADDLYVNGTPILESLGNIDVPFATKDVAGKIYIWEEGETLYIKNTEPLIVFRDFSENTPATIALVSNEIAANSMTSAQVEETYGWKLGDKISITLTTGEVIEMQIIGFNHDDKSDGSGKAGITLQMVNCLATTYSINSISTNAGGYAASVMKTSTLPTIKTLLPQEWQDVIKLVDKKSANGGSYNYSETLSLSEDLFLFAEIEIFGTSSAQDGMNEGSVYEYWNGKSYTDRIKKYDANAAGVADTVILWWLRSCPSGSPSNFRAVATDGYSTVSAAINSRGVAFGFCI